MDALSISKRFGVVVKRRRLDLGLSQEQLAELSGVHPTYIGMIERGTRNPTLDVADKVASGLSTELAILISEAVGKISTKEGTER